MKISQQLIDENLESKIISIGNVAVENIIKQIGGEGISFETSSNDNSSGKVVPEDFYKIETKNLTNEIKFMKSASVVSAQVSNTNKLRESNINSDKDETVVSINLEEDEYWKELIDSCKEIISKNKMKMKEVVYNILERSTNILSNLFQNYLKPRDKKEELSAEESSS